jgi:cobalt-zinc-cadmium efflux system outer membrane protein
MKERCLQAICAILILLGPPLLRGQQPLTWQEVQDKFHAANRSLQAGQIGVDESRASETTAYLRPNPTLNVLNDQINPFNGGPPHNTFGFLLSTASVSYLHERERKRELRLESAQDATKIAVSGQADLDRNLIFNLRMAFVQTLQGKLSAILLKKISRTTTMFST